MKRIFMTVIVLLGSIPFSQSHSWYDTACCNDKDCRPISTDAIYEKPEGIEVSIEGRKELVSYSALMQSKDGQWHVCLKEPTHYSPSIIRCLYRPVAG